MRPGSRSARRQPCWHPRDMEEVRRSYSRLCKERGAEPQETVLQRLQELPRGRLDLATQSLTADTCRALGKLLQKEALVTELVLSDCMLSEEGGHRGRLGPGPPLQPQNPGWGLALCLGAAVPCVACPWLRGCSIAPSSVGRPPLCSVVTGKQQGHLKPGSRGQFLFVTEKP